MKKKIIYLLALACCIATYTSAKQLYRSEARDTSNVCRPQAKKQLVKSKKLKAATIRPFNFYLINI